MKHSSFYNLITYNQLYFYNQNTIYICKIDFLAQLAEHILYTDGVKSSILLEVKLFWLLLCLASTITIKHHNLGTNKYTSII